MHLILDFVNPDEDMMSWSICECQLSVGEHPFVASDVEGCQGVAKKQGRLFMNYDAATKKCYTSRTCPLLVQRPESRSERCDMWCAVARHGRNTIFSQYGTYHIDTHHSFQ